jgi:hypothetical protein
MDVSERLSPNQLQQCLEPRYTPGIVWQTTVSFSLDRYGDLYPNAEQEFLSRLKVPLRQDDQFDSGNGGGASKNRTCDLSIIIVRSRTRKTSKPQGSDRKDQMVRQPRHPFPDTMQPGMIHRWERKVPWNLHRRRHD